MERRVLYDPGKVWLIDMDGILRPLKVVAAGGDLRMSVLARLMREDGHDVSVFAAEDAPAASPPLRAAGDADLARADLVVLPLPAIDAEGSINAPFSSVRISPEKLFSGLRRGTLVAAGMVSESLRAAAVRHGLRIEDYAAREEFAVRNAVPTAEGAIEIAMGMLGVTLHRSRALVVGFGRIGKLLALKLRALGTDVTASARKYSDLAWIDAFGCRSLRTSALAEAVGQFDIVFNTVPARVLGRAELEVLRPEAPVIDLASRPGGVDMDAALELGREVTWALSLPGRCSPVTAGEIIRDTVYNILDETAGAAEIRGNNNENNT